jgi:CubicO group peptidase (beta-lactamase class C family)
MLKFDIPKLEKTLINRIDKDIAEGTVIGASCAVMQGDERICTIIRGVSDPQTMSPLHNDNIFRLASMTKLLTIAGLLLQIEQGKISYDTPVSNFLPGFKEKWIAKAEGFTFDEKTHMPNFENASYTIDRKAEVPITLNHLVTHTSGLGSGIAGMLQAQEMTDAQKATVTTVADFYANEAVLDFEPGAHWAYSGLAAFDIMARIIEMLTDMEFADYLKKYIFSPLELKDMTFVPSDEQWGRMVALHDREDGKAVARGGRTVLGNYPLTYSCGGGGLVSTLDDYCKFVKMLMDGGVYNGRRILKEESVKAMGTQRLPDEITNKPGQTTWGVGCMIYKNFPPMPAGCYGWSGAFGTHMWVDPVNKVGAVYMRNSAFAAGAEADTARNFETDVYSASIIG